MGKVSPSSAGSTVSIPGWGAKIPRALQPKKTKQKQYWNKCNKDFKNVHIQKKKKKNLKQPN